MRVAFQLIDCDYILPNGHPVIRIFGKTEDGKSVVCFYEGFLPYFYVLPNVEDKEISQFLKKEFNNLIVNVEEVKKFLPIGYNPEKVKLLKITLSDPSKVPKVKESLISSGLVKEAYEADILFRYRFMIDYDLYGSRWYEVEGIPVNTQNVKAKIKLTLKKIKEIEPRESKFKILTFDIEAASDGLPDPENTEIIIISLYFDPPYKKKKKLALVATKKINGDDILSFENEKEMLKEFINIIDSYDPDIILGYNILRFDFPFLLKRLEKNKLPKTLGRCSTKPATHKKFGQTERVNVPGRIVVDPYQILQEYNKKGMLRFKRFGLGDVAEQVIGEGKIDISHSQIKEIWEKGSKEELRKLIDYAIKDSEITYKLFNTLKLIDTYLALSRVSGALLQDVLDGGEASRLEILLIREFDRHDFVVPLKPSDKEVMKRTEERSLKGLKGALVLDPVVGFHKNVIYLDFASMYPKIIIGYNICPTTILTKEFDVETIETPNKVKFVSKKVREGIFPKILKQLIESRNKVKKRLKQEKNEKIKQALNAEQLALKILANAFYGYTGYLRARLYLLDIANAITASGRFLISKTKNIVETKTKYKVVYGDTDSVMIKADTEDIEELFRIGEELAELINRELGVVKMKIESVFKTLLILSKKRYAGLSLEKSDTGYKEKIIMKGIETVRRDWCTLTEETLEKILEIILKEEKPEKALLYIRDVIQKLQNNEIPIDKLVIYKSISRPLHLYKGVQPHIELVKKLKKRGAANIPGIGDRVGYVIVQGPQMVSKRAEDPEYAKQNNLKIDSQYYLESQILPPLERVFEALGYRRQDILNLGKQLSLGSIVNNGNSRKVVGFDGFVCSYCNETYETITLSGKCIKCNGPIYFYKGKEKIKEISWNS